MDDKQTLRKRLRALRRQHVAALPQATRGLVLHRPPAPIGQLVPAGSVVGLYHASQFEAPTRGYAEWFFENGRRVALPWFAGRDSAMRFRLWSDPFGDAGIETGPWGMSQPGGAADEVEPDVVFVPLLGFTAHGDRIGQGAGHYDLWLADHPSALAIGLAWDCQLVDALPREPHDKRLRAVVTPTRIYERGA